MRLEEIVKKIKEDLKLAKGLKNINIHISDFENKEDKPYIEFTAQDKRAERMAFRFYSKWSKIIRLNCPRISISYNTPYPRHNDNLKRIVVEVDNEITNPREKEELLKGAALHFYQILKNGTKYQTKNPPKKSL